MKTLYLAATMLGLLATELPARSDTLSPEEKETVRQLQESEPPEENARLVRQSRRVVRERGGDRVVITRRTYEDPAGVLSMRETRRPLTDPSSRED